MSYEDEERRRKWDFIQGHMPYPSQEHFGNRDNEIAMSRAERLWDELKWDEALRAGWHPSPADYASRFDGHD